MRHAKSDWNQPGLADHARGLNKRGKRDALRMGRALAEQLQAMNLHVSSARRAQLTLRGMIRAWPQLENCAHPTEQRLYTFSADELIQWLTEQDDALGTLFIISHNPALTDLVNRLVGLNTLENLPTAGYVHLALHIDHWKDMLQGSATLECILFPKQLEG